VAVALLALMHNDLLKRMIWTLLLQSTLELAVQLLPEPGQAALEV
jgi:hypothetical protein